MVSVELIAALVGGAGIARGFGPIARRLLAARTQSTVHVTITRDDGSSATLDLDTKDAAQAEELVRAFLEDQVVSVEPEKEKHDGHPVGSE